MKIGPKMQEILNSLVEGSLSIPRIAEMHNITYDRAKTLVKQLKDKGQIDITRIANPTNHNRVMVQLGTGKTWSQYTPNKEAIKRRERREELALLREEKPKLGCVRLPDGSLRGPNGGRVVELTNRKHWAFGGQGSLYGLMTKSLITELE
jgi:hypothetical protein